MAAGLGRHDLGEPRPAPGRHRRALHPGSDGGLVAADAGVLRVLRHRGGWSVPGRRAHAARRVAAAQHPRRSAFGELYLGLDARRRGGPAAARSGGRTPVGRPRDRDVLLQSRFREGGGVGVVDESERRPVSGLSPTDDPLTGPFFEAAAQGRLVVQRCNSCKELRWPPLSGCPECRSRDTTWVDVAPTGTVWSFVVYHRAFAAELRAHIPYTVLMVE